MKSTKEIKRLRDLITFWYSDKFDMGIVEQHKVYVRNNHVYLALEKTNFLPFDTERGSTYDSFDEFYSLVISMLDKLIAMLYRKNTFNSEDLESLMLIRKHFTIKTV
jgi:hypothetical protein